MKKVLTKIFALSGIALFMLSSCKKSDPLVTSNGGKPGALTASVTGNFVLDKSKLTDASPAITFNFTDADYGYSAAVTNTLQIDAAGDNWANPTSATLKAKTSTQSYSTADFNNLLLKLNLPADVSSAVQIRVMHSVSANVPPVYSNALSLNVTPFNLSAWVYVPGAYEGWGNPGPQEDSLYSATGNGVYVGIINFTPGNRDFLITPKKAWDNKYATNDGGTTSATNVTYSTIYVTGGGNNFFAPTTSGQYKLTLNTNNNTLTIEPADKYYSVIGDAAQGWGTDVDMKYINDGSGLWTINVPLVSTGQFKVRKNHDWAISYGVPKTGADGKTLASNDDDNIPVTTTGTYKFTFLPTADDKTAAFTLVKQ